MDQPDQYNLEIDLRISKVEGVTDNLVEDNQNEFESDDSFDRETFHKMIAPRQIVVGSLPVHIKPIHFFTELNPRITEHFWEVYNQFAIFKADIILSECIAHVLANSQLFLTN